MTLTTLGFDVEGTFFKRLKAIVALIETDLQTASQAEALTFYPQREPETFPAVRCRLLAGAGIERRRRVARVQIDLFVESDPAYPDDGLLALIRDSLEARLGISTKRAAFHAYFDALGYFANAAGPAFRRHARLELVDPAGGWPEVIQPVPEIKCISRDFKILY